MGSRSVARDWGWCRLRWRSLGRGAEAEPALQRARWRRQTLGPGLRSGRARTQGRKAGQEEKPRPHDGGSPPSMQCAVHVHTTDEGGSDLATVTWRCLSCHGRCEWAASVAICIDRTDPARQGVQHFEKPRWRSQDRTPRSRHRHHRKRPPGQPAVQNRLPRSRQRLSRELRCSTASDGRKNVWSSGGGEITCRLSSGTAEIRVARRATSVDVIRMPTKGPGDVSGLVNLIEAGKVEPAAILAILGKTEGNGGVNDFTREYAVSALCGALAPHVGLPPHSVEEKIAFVMSGGTEGVLSPHITVFARTAIADPGLHSDIAGKRLSIGIAHTRDFMPEELSRTVQIDETAAAVRTAMADAGIDDPRDVHFVQIKCPLLTIERIDAAHAKGNKTVTTSAYGSMAYSRGASALGVAVALGEIDGDIRDEQVLKDWNLSSSVASTSSGIELMHNVVIVFGNSAASASPFIIGHAVMRDAIDSAAVLDALKSVGLVSAISPIRLRET